MADVNDFNQQIIDEYRSNAGKLGGQFNGARLLLLHSSGAKSGTERVNPLAYRNDGGHLVVFGSKAGAPTNPDWYHNLRANPRASVEVGADRYDVIARVAEGEERERIWRDQKEEAPRFADYERLTDRPIPVIVLERT